MRKIPKQKGDFFIADGRTAWVVRNGVRTQKRMFETEAECSEWVRRMNR